MKYSELGRINLLLNHDGTEVFRQKRFTQDDIKLQLNYQGKSFIISNWSRTGLNFQTLDSAFEIGEKLDVVTISVNKHEIYKGNIQIKSKTQDDVGIHYGGSFLYNLFPIEAVEALQCVDDFTQFENENEEKFKELNQDICRLILEMKHILHSLEKRCEGFEKSVMHMSYDDRNIAEACFLEKMSESVHAVFVKLNKQAGNLIDIDTIQPGSYYHVLFDENIYPFFQLADITRRAKEKPLGYAGDFEMMNQIYRGGYEGKNIFGKILHHYIATEISSQSVLFRRPYFCDHYQKKLNEKKTEDVYVMSLASGPCVEFQKLIEILPQEELSRIRLTLLDLDAKSLEHAQSKIYEQCLRYDKSVNVQFIHASVKAFIESTDMLDNNFDLIYSGGLFDYLDNQVSSAIVTNLFKTLNGDGRIVIGNFTEENSTKAFCHLMTDWHLIHKTEQEIRDWAKNIEKCKVGIDYDDNHINAFLVLEK